MSFTIRNDILFVFLNRFYGNVFTKNRNGYIGESD